VKLPWSRRARPTPLKRCTSLPGLTIYAIGDIHGRLDALTSLLAAIDARKARTGEPAFEVFLGDYIDRGPDARRVIEIILARQSAHRLLALSGNHEAALLAGLGDDAAFAAWLDIGGRQTLVSYGVRPPSLVQPESLSNARAKFAAALPASHRAFLASLGLWFRSGDYFFAHAGVRPGVPLHKQVAADLLWIRKDFLDSREDHGAMIVHGHTPVPAPDFHPYRINIDTGAYATGKLTCLIVSDAGMETITT
jgi:serine/threonine protein phosphatase 1